MNTTIYFYVHASRVIILKGVILFYNDNVGSCGWNDIILKFENRPCIFCSTRAGSVERNDQSAKTLCTLSVIDKCKFMAVIDQWPWSTRSEKFQLTCQRCTFYFLTSLIHLKIIKKNHFHKFRMLLTM